MTRRASTVAIVCPDCETRVEVPIEAAGATLANHNDQRHGGEAVASVAGYHVDRFF